MKKTICAFLACIMLLVSTVYAEAPSPSADRYFDVNPPMSFTTNVDISSTVYPVVVKYYNAFLVTGLGPNFDLDQVVILYPEQLYQLVNFTFPTFYPQTCSVMAVFFGSGIWIRTGMILNDGSVIFDMTEIYGDEVEMFIFSNYDAE